MDRLFIAIYPSEQIIKRLLEFENEIINLFVGRLSSKENLHITLQFLGYVKEKDRKDISENIRKSIQNISSFEIFYRSVGFFRDVLDPNILWIGIEDQANLLTLIANKLKKANAKFVKRESKKFSPHLTVARIKSIEHEKALRILEIYKDVKFGKDLVTEVCLVKSEVSREGARYTVLERFQLSI